MRTTSDMLARQGALDVGESRPRRPSAADDLAVAEPDVAGRGSVARAAGDGVAKPLGRWGCVGCSAAPPRNIVPSRSVGMETQAGGRASTLRRPGCLQMVDISRSFALADPASIGATGPHSGLRGTMDRAARRPRLTSWLVAPYRWCSTMARARSSPTSTACRAVRQQAERHPRPPTRRSCRR